MFFSKMEGLGNDYIYLNCLHYRPHNLPKLAQTLSRRRFGVGADGIICICPSIKGDFAMEMYNADGSQGEMCGNGIRCLGKYVYDKGLTDRHELTIETAGGVRTLFLHMDELGAVEEVTVNMGKAVIAPHRQYTVDHLSFVGTPVSVGNPHLILYWDDLNSAPVKSIGRQLEHHPDFPNRTNVEFISVPTRDNIHMRVWERGSGETFACGTGACAAFAASYHDGLCENAVTMHLTGGALILSYQDNDIYMRGPARMVYEGEISWGNFSLTSGEK